MCHPDIPEGQETPQVRQLEVEIPLSDGLTMPALLCRPDSDDGPRVVIIADIFGRSPFYESLAARLADAGFLAVLPELFFRQGELENQTQEAAFERRNKLDDWQALADLQRTIDWLKAAGASPRDNAGIMGFCMGGTFSLLLASERDDLATVCYYGFPAQRRSDSGPPAPQEVVDRMDGPILGFWGAEDAAVGIDNVYAFAASLESRGADFEYRVYPGLGHGFLAASRLDPDHTAYEAASDAWTRTLDFLRAQLLEEPPTAGHG